MLLVLEGSVSKPKLRNVEFPLCILLLTKECFNFQCCLEMGLHIEAFFLEAFFLDSKFVGSEIT